MVWSNPRGDSINDPNGECLEEEMVELLVVDGLGRAYVRGMPGPGRVRKLVLIERGVRPRS